MEGLARLPHPIQSLEAMLSTILGTSVLLLLDLYLFALWAWSRKLQNYFFFPESVVNDYSDVLI